MIDDGLLRDRLMARLSGFFGALAVLLAVIGLYGVISYMVARRRNEIGIRMSLGADGRSIVALVLRESVLLLSIGLACGVALALAPTERPLPPAVRLEVPRCRHVNMATVILAAIGLAASYLPALRASKSRPLECPAERIVGCVLQSRREYPMPDTASIIYGRSGPRGRLS